MSLTIEEVQRIAKLARIKLTDAQLATTQTELTYILNMIERLRTIDTTGVIPMAHAKEVSLTLRPDVVTEVNQRETFQQLAPQVEEGLYLVPKVIE